MIIFIFNVLRFVNSLNLVKEFYREVLVVVEIFIVVFYYIFFVIEYVFFFIFIVFLWNGFIFVVFFRICVGVWIVDYSWVVDRVLRVGYG